MQKNTEKKNTENKNIENKNIESKNIDNENLQDKSFKSPNRTNLNMSNKKRKKSAIIYISIAMITVLLNVIAWNSTAFCDAYIAYVFPIWVNTYGRVTGLFPFSVGEWMLVTGVVLVAAAVLTGVAGGVVGISSWMKKVSEYRTDGRTENTCAENESFEEPEVEIVKFIKMFYKYFAWIVLGVCVIMTLNCSILYHASTFSENYFGKDNGEYTLEQFIEVYNYVAEACNRLCQEVPRDEEGKIVYSGNAMADEAIVCMQKLGETYPQLDGWYPRPKPMMFSDFMCQQYMCGYYFPFSMEANYNDVMYIMNKPATLCHELAHLRGYIYEDEANFIAYLACLESEDAVFQYSGYLSVITYLYNDLYKAYTDEPEAYQQAVSEVSPVPVLSQVWEDNIFVEQEEWDRINGKALLDTETVDEISDTFTDTTLKLNGVSDGMVSYSRVVRLLLQYYASEGMIP